MDMDIYNHVTQNEIRKLTQDFLDFAVGAFAHAVADEISIANELRSLWFDDFHDFVGGNSVDGKRIFWVV